MAIAKIRIEIIATALALSHISHTAAEERKCPVTDPAVSAVEVPWSGTNSLAGNNIWYGTESLAVLLPPDGPWERIGARKLWFWSEDWSSSDEPKPDLQVDAQELYDSTLTTKARSTTHGYGDEWEAMLTGFDFPAPGCRKVTAAYRKTKVSFVVAVQD